MEEKEVIVKLAKGDDGYYWLRFNSSKGPVDINLNVQFDKTGIIKRNIMAWAEEQFN